MESSRCQFLNSGGNGVLVAPFRRGIADEQGCALIKQHAICGHKLCIALGNVDAFECVGGGESILANESYSFWKGDGTDVFCPTKGQTTHTLNHFGHLHLACALLKALQQRVVGIADKQAIHKVEVVVGGRHAHLGKTFKVRKSPFANLFYRCRQVHAAYARAYKGTLANAFQAFGQVGLAKRIGVGKGIRPHIFKCGGEIYVGYVSKPLQPMRRNALHLCLLQVDAVQIIQQTGLGKLGDETHVGIV